MSEASRTAFINVASSFVACFVRSARCAAMYLPLTFSLVFLCLSFGRHCRLDQCMVLAFKSPLCVRRCHRAFVKPLGPCGLTDLDEDSHIKLLRQRQKQRFGPRRYLRWATVCPPALAVDQFALRHHQILCPPTPMGAKIVALLHSGQIQHSGELLNLCFAVAASFRASV